MTAAPPARTPTPAPTGEGLVACPYCDALNRDVTPAPGGRIRCGRCGEVLTTNRPHALDRTLAAAIASVILMAGAIMFPFLELHTFGLTRKASVLDAALAFSSGLTTPLALAVGMLIVVIPIMRAVALAYVVLPLRLGRPPAPGAREAFRLSAQLRPWSMAEVFIIGVVVALVKVAGMASVSLGPAFWAMACMVLLVALEATSLDDWSIWRRLDTARR